MTMEEVIAMILRLTNDISATIVFLILSVIVQIMHHKALVQAATSGDAFQSFVTEATTIISTCFWFATIILFTIFLARRVLRS